MKFVQYPSLENSVAVVSGGASGIGADIVRALVHNQVKVAFLDIQVAVAEALVAELEGVGPTPLFIKCDVTSIADLQDALALASERLGPISTLANNAGHDQRHTIEELTPEYWDANHAINLKHLFFAAKAVYPEMEKLGGGSVINISSIAWHGGSPNMVAYTTAKAGIIGMTHSLAKAFGVGNVRVNAIEPGAVITPRQRELWYKTEAEVDDIVQKQSLNKILTGTEIARMVLFLASDQSDMITKQSFIVDAGIF